MSPSRLRLHAAALVMAAGLSACAGLAQTDPLEMALYDYSSQVRWSEYENASIYLDPAKLAVEPLEPLEMERLKQYQVSSYEVKTFAQPAEDLVEQTVEIRIVNRHTQVERTITDHQRWRWDPVAKRWWLISGLPDVSQD